MATNSIDAVYQP